MLSPDSQLSIQVASIYGLLNIFTRPFGGYLADIIYQRYGVTMKKHLVLLCGVLMGFMSIALGLYMDHHDHPSPSRALKRNFRKVSDIR